jgi:hypothetical protein
MARNLKTDYGAVGDGTTDDTAAFQAFLTASKPGGESVVPAGTYKVTDTLLVQDTTCLHLYGEGRTGEVGAVTVRWDGPAGGSVFKLDGVRDSEFADITVRDGAHRPGTGWDYDYFRVPGPGMTVPTACRFTRLFVRNAEVGFAFMRTYKGNGELMTFDHCQVQQDVWSGSTKGFFINRPNSMGHVFHGGGVNLCGQGIHLDGGSFSAYGINFQQNVVDLFLDNPSGAITLVGVQQENSIQFLGTGASGAPMPLSVLGGRFAIAQGMTRGDVAGRYLFYGYGGPFTLENCAFAGAGANGYDELWHIQVGVHQGWNESNFLCLGCQFPGPAPLQYGNAVPGVGQPGYDPDRDTGLARAFGRGNTRNDGTGAAIPFANFDR